MKRLNLDFLSYSFASDITFTFYSSQPRFKMFLPPLYFAFMRLVFLSFSKFQQTCCVVFRRTFVPLDMYTSVVCFPRELSQWDVCFCASTSNFRYWIIKSSWRSRRRVIRFIGIKRSISIWSPVFSFLRTLINTSHLCDLFRWLEIVISRRYLARKVQWSGGRSAFFNCSSSGIMWSHICGQNLVALVA